MADATLRAPDGPVRGALLSLLGGYDEASLSRALGAPPGTPVTAIPDVEARVQRLEEPLRTLIRLFRLGHDVPRTDVERAIDTDGRETLTSTGLLVREGESYRPMVQLIPFGPLLVAGDPIRRHVAGASDFVVGPFAATRKLAGYLLPGPHDSVLDLGCGGGALALHAASTARRVVAVDVNERAVRFTKFNAALNGLDGVEARAGNLFEPVQGERFDLIVCNPPYVISPDETFAYRDGGTGICRTIVRESVDHLRSGGRLQMLAEWPQRGGEAWHAEVARWLEGTDADVWVLRHYEMDPRRYARAWLEQEYMARGPVPAGELARWARHFESQGTEAIAGGLIVAATGRPGAPIRSFHEVPPLGETGIGASLDRWMNAQVRAAELLDAELLDADLVPAPGLERTQKGEVNADGWTTTRSELRLREGLRFGATVDPVAEEVVGLMATGRTAREAMAALASRHGLTTDPFEDGLADAVRKLLELGLLVPGSD